MRQGPGEKNGLNRRRQKTGMIVGARIAIPAFVVGIIGWFLTPYLLSVHWLEPGQTYRKTGFIFSLGAILGASIVDIGLILFNAARTRRKERAQPAPSEDWNDSRRADCHSGFCGRYYRMVLDTLSAQCPLA